MLDMLEAMIELETVSEDVQDIFDVINEEMSDEA